LAVDDASSLGVAVTAADGLGAGLALVPVGTCGNGEAGRTTVDVTTLRTVPSELGTWWGPVAD
jgi:hypothetical protein